MVTSQSDGLSRGNELQQAPHPRFRVGQGYISTGIPTLLKVLSLRQGIKSACLHQLHLLCVVRRRKTRKENEEISATDMTHNVAQQATATTHKGGERVKLSGAQPLEANNNHSSIIYHHLSFAGLRGGWVHSGQKAPKPARN